jgi:hypothetical protein
MDSIVYTSDEKGSGEEMSVVRFGPESDVYMWPSGDCYFDCACGVTSKGIDAAKNHLEQHRSKGDKVPDYAFTDLASRNPVTGSRR